MIKAYEKIFPIYLSYTFEQVFFQFKELEVYCVFHIEKNLFASLDFLLRNTGLFVAMLYNRSQIYDGKNVKFNFVDEYYKYDLYWIVENHWTTVWEAPGFHAGQARPGWLFLAQHGLIPFSYIRVQERDEKEWMMSRKNKALFPDEMRVYWKLLWILKGWETLHE